MKISPRPLVPLFLALALAAALVPWRQSQLHPDPEVTTPATDRMARPPDVPVAHSSQNLLSAAVSPLEAAVESPFAKALRPARVGAVRVAAKADADPEQVGRALPLTPDFLDRLVDATANRARFPLPDGRTATGSIQLMRKDGSGIVSVQGLLETPAAGSFFFQRQTAPGTAGAMVGNVRLDESSVAWRIDPAGPNGQPLLTEVSVGQVLCVGKPMPESAGDSTPVEAADLRPRGTEPPGTPQNAPQTHPTNMSIPGSLNGIIPLQSHPGATGVVYLDFDGEPGPFTGWISMNRDAASSGATNTQIKEVWQRVAEDFQGFNLNITTDRRVFDRAAEGRRMQVIITPTRDASPNAGGVAFLRSFNWTGNTVCWCFSLTGKSAAEVISHEVGHTLGLAHDGRTSPVEEYYGGHSAGDVGWAPIMGVGYSKSLTQWSKGEYFAPSNREDDLAIIVNNNNSVDYLRDDSTATYATADYLDILPNFSVSNEGIIETSVDVDAWRFQTGGGAVGITVSTVNAGPNLDVLAEIYTGDDVLVASNNPDVSLGATVTATLAAGDYTLRISGTGRGDRLTTGYSDYGSLGTYLLTGSVSNGVRHDHFSVNENTPNGTTVGTVLPRLAHGANPISFSILTGNTGGAFQLSSATGVLTIANSAALNYENLSAKWDDPATLELFVRVTDATVPSLNETLRVVVNINPVNEPPTLSGTGAIMFTRTSAETPVTTVTTSDPDRFDFPLLSIVAGNTSGAFAINSVTGLITTTDNVPTTVPALPITLTVRATDRGTPALTTDLNLTMKLLEAPAGKTPGRVRRSYFDSITGTTVASLTGNSRFPSSPSSEEEQTVLDADAHGNNYGSTARAWIIPPATGGYIFWITSDDSSQLSISPDATPGGAVLRASAASATGRYEYTKFTSQQSVAINLTAGLPYYLEARHKQSTGADHLVVAWQGPGITRQPISGIYLAPYEQSYAPQITLQSFPVRRGSSAGTRIGTVVAANINPDATFGSFTITGGTAAAWCAIDANTGLLYVTDSAALSAASFPSYTLTVRASDGASANLTGSGTITLNVLAPTVAYAGGVVQEVWTGITGNAVTFLTSNSRYPDSPTSTRNLSSFDSGLTSLGDNYGSRIRAFVIPPVSGNYNFYITGDNESQLRFTAGTNYGSLNPVAAVNTAGQRNVFTTFTLQKSAAFALTAGQKYYLETRHKNGTGPDFVQVGWTGPGIGSPTIIPGSALEPFDRNIAPAWAAASYNFTVREGSPVDSLIGAVSGTDPENAPLVYTIAGGNTGGAIALNPNTGTLTVANSAALVPGTPLSLTLQAADDGAAGFFPPRAVNINVILQVTRDFTLISPSCRMVNLPAGQGLGLESKSSGRAGATLLWSKVRGPGPVIFDSQTSYDTGATFSEPGIYVLRAVETAAAVPLTLEISVLCGADVPLPAGVAIGTHADPPGHAWTAGSWQIEAGGTGLTETTADGCYFIQQPGGSNFTLTARVQSVSDVSGHLSMAGLMIRQGSGAEARSLFCGVTSRSGVRFLQRSTPGLPARQLFIEDPETPRPFTPIWLRMTRAGNTFTVFTAPDSGGAPGPFIQFGPASILPLADPCLVGLASTSGVSGMRNTAVIDHLTITPSLANLGPAITINSPATSYLDLPASLGGVVSDDTLPTFPGITTRLWKKVTGPGAVSFTAPASLNTSASFAAVGDHVLRLTADDGEVRTFRDVRLAVAATAPPIEIWRQTRFSFDVGNRLIAGDEADPDFDSLPNLIEYALGLDPLALGADPLTLTPSSVDGQTYLRLAVGRNPAATDVVTTVETTATPSVNGSWGSSGLTVETNNPETLQVRTRQPIELFPAQFLRVKVTR